MKTFQINIQTLLFLTDNSVLGAYNENSKILVYNKPLVQEDKLQEMIAFVTAQGKEVRSTYQTDNFGVNFYDHKTGGSSEFHEVKGKMLEGIDPIDYRNISKEEFTEFCTVLKEIDEEAYNEEAADNFVDCYNYWSGLGHTRFMDKHNQNKARLQTS